jgi:vanillate O-demethylase monooxygenase subunit
MTDDRIIGERPRFRTGSGASQLLSAAAVEIEAQQRVIDATPEPKIMPTAHDGGVRIFNRLVERLAGEEPRRPGSAA